MGFRMHLIEYRKTHYSGDDLYDFNYEMDDFYFILYTFNLNDIVQTDTAIYIYDFSNENKDELMKKVKKKAKEVNWMYLRITLEQVENVIRALEAALHTKQFKENEEIIFEWF